ncbi:MAG: hypothetical protein K6E75_01020 [Lachnospiraceae bacterium]|nr:hypothetical protein [Lachnospiraceae bacterium]
MCDERMTKQYRILAVSFLIIIFVLGFLSDGKLIRYYVKDEVINEMWTPDLGEKKETEYAQVFFGKDAFVNLNGLMRRIIGQSEMNTVVRLKNGQLTQVKQKAKKKKDMKKEAANVAAFQTYLEGRGIPFLYVIPMDKIAPEDGSEKGVNGSDQIPTGFLDYSNKNIEMFRTQLDKYGVHYIDLRDDAQNAGQDWYSFFYKTDHHWNAEAGWMAYKKIEDWVVNNTNVQLDERAGKIENYEIEEHRNCLLGSWGQRTGRLFGGTDDLRLYIPEYETDFENLTSGKRGRMDEVLYNRGAIQQKPDMIYDNVYDSLDQIVDHSASNQTTMLVVTDSFGRVVCPFLALGVRNMWFHSCYQTAQINEEMIDRLQPDLVIVLQSAWNNLGSDASFSYDVPGIKKE